MFELGIYLGCGLVFAIFAYAMLLKRGMQCPLTSEDGEFFKGVALIFILIVAWPIILFLIIFIICANLVFYTFLKKSGGS